MSRSKSFESFSRELYFAVAGSTSPEALEIALVEGQSGDVLYASWIREGADLQDRGARPLERNDVTKLVEIERCGCADADHT